MKYVFSCLILVVWLGVIEKELLPKDVEGVCKKEQDIIDISVRWAYQNGLLKKTGIAIAKDALVTGQAMLESGAVTLEEMERDTKGGGWEEYGLFVQQGLWNMARKPVNKVLLMALSRKGGKETFMLDESIYKRVVDREVSFLELQNIAYGKLGSDPILAGRIRQPLRLLEEILVDGSSSQWRQAIISLRHILTDSLSSGIISKDDLSHIDEEMERACGRK